MLTYLIQMQMLKFAREMTRRRRLEMKRMYWNLSRRELTSEFLTGS